MTTQKARGLAITVFAFAVALLTNSVYGQVHVCLENGQKVFRSTQCPEEAEPLGTYKAPSTPRASSGKRKQSSWDSKEMPDAECRFSYYAMGDSKGMALARKAKEECLNNKALLAAGRPKEQQLTAYQMWLDHSKLTQSARQRAASQVTPQLNCVPNGFGGLRCSP